jgi:NAD(P)-dependent dehydrogenase (short-subunit alcohol dehydrogenase family)
MGTEVLALVADVSREADVERLVGAAAERFGHVDVLVNNAGVLGPRVAIEKYPEDEWRRVIDANLTGLFLVTKAAIPHMPEGASIVNVVRGVSVEGRAGWGASYPEEDPMTRITPEENTDVFLYLASEESRDVTGQRFKAQEFRKA